ncbi:RluA family pseudouridine synthase [Pelovirga terrestris]|uniref:RluA family pseudouridine synthase n=1 Tax=Pelovirga terrestris TaxID=2771352 RepID=A0A8J6QRK6_9BACT|nr:RluA family pseudouridine synthase [Pelovirga terrestris]MBD1400330.1 RluA family pseudouridine synthase [Pelovirga terrestris]
MAKMIVTTTEAGLSLEDFLQQRVAAAPAAYLRKLVKDGKICRSEDTAGALVAGEHIILPDSRRLVDLLTLSEKMSVTVLYESEHLLILDKPSGLATHAGQGHEEDNLTARVAGLLHRRGEPFVAAPIQRLDRETSGVVLFGKGKKSCSVLGKMMMNAPVKKTYLALVKGNLTTAGTITTEIPAKGKSKTAVTSYLVLAANDSASLLQIELKTGRQHQIRRQFQQIGHPLFGDRRYCGPCPDNLPRLFLHCRQLAFDDPFTNTPVKITSPVPQNLRTFLEDLNVELHRCNRHFGVEGNYPCVSLNLNKDVIQ